MIRSLYLVILVLLATSCSLVLDETTNTGTISGATQTGNTVAAIAVKSSVSESELTLIENITVKLFRADSVVQFIGQTDLTVTSATTGTYTFTKIPPGTYYIAFYYFTKFVGEEAHIEVSTSVKTIVPVEHVTSTPIESEYPLIYTTILFTDICFDTLDNDNDGLIDCDDGDECSGPLDLCKSNLENTEPWCTDSIDNDLDSLIDCDDPDCQSLQICTVNLTGERSFSDCSDFIDNDSNGLIDCKDPSCAVFAFCETSTEMQAINCTNTSADTIPIELNCYDSNYLH